MVCELCNERESVIHVQQMIGNETIDMRLCEGCAHEKGISRKEDRTELSLSQLLTGLLEVTDSETTVEVCPSCGMRLEEFKKTGNLGCPSCYGSFTAEIRAMHKKLSGKTHHRGKLPKKLLTFKSLLIDRETLRKQLDEAVGKEDYEAAAVLRDRIKTIEHHGGSVDA